MCNKIWEQCIFYSLYTKLMVVFVRKRYVGICDEILLVRFLHLTLSKAFHLSKRKKVISEDLKSESCARPIGVENFPNELRAMRGYSLCAAIPSPL